MAYLTTQEISDYCKSIMGVTDYEVKIASTLIDAFLGHVLLEETYTDTITLNKKCRGKLTKSPVTEIVEVKSITITPFGISESSVPNDSVYLDDDYGYFSYVDTGMNYIVWGTKPNKLRVKYKAGLTSVPENVKIATGILAQNIKQKGSFSGMKEIQTLDYRVAFMDDSIFTREVITLLSPYRGV